MADLGGLGHWTVSGSLAGKSGRRIRIEGWSGVHKLRQDGLRSKAVVGQVPKRPNVWALDDQAVVFSRDRCGIAGWIQEDQAAPIAASDLLDRLQAHTAGKVDHDGVDRVLRRTLPTLHPVDLGEVIVGIQQGSEGRRERRVITEQYHVADHR
jgi:hypothetical protein